MKEANLESALAAVVGAHNVLVAPDVRATYEIDWTRRFHGTARGVVRPATTTQVAEVLRACATHAAPVVVQGGNTGLVGGSVPAGGEVILSTTQLRSLGDVDPVAGQVTVGAGVTLAAAQAHVRPHGFDIAVDLAARDSATIGGLVATNAGGEHVLRYGSMRRSLAGLSVVFADGTVASRLAGLPKDNTGYDLVGLLAGSEGTLAVITEVRLQLIPALPSRTVALLGLAGVPHALEVLGMLKTRLSVLESAELFFAAGLTLVCTRLGLPRPMPGEHPAYLLIEAADRRDVSTPLFAALEEVPAEDVAIAEDATARHRLWRYREAHAEAIATVGIPVKLDIVVPLAALTEFVADVPTVVTKASPGARTVIFGHLNEGNLHVNVLGADGAEPAVERAVLEYVASLSGSISGEHGIGRAKVPYLSLSRAPAEIAAMRAIKRALDPTGLLNPGVLLPPD
jgi:FAD/FMN-containing dehydrogenase